MQIEIDSFYSKGAGHQVCQDYIITGTEPFPYIILADGCSSSPHTDIGARIICHKIKRFYEHQLPINIKTVMHSCDEVRRFLNLPQECLDCTIIMCTLTSNTINIYIYGDGSYFIEFNNGHYKYGNISFSNNAPFYPNYLINEQRKKNYPDNKLITTHIINYGGQEGNEISTFTGERASVSITPYYDFDTATRIKSIMISSDGLSSFGLSFDKVYQYFSSFKTTKGEFIKRRAKRALKELADVGYHNYDDISIGGMYLCHNTTSQK